MTNFNPINNNFFNNFQNNISPKQLDVIKTDMQNQNAPNYASNILPNNENEAINPALVFDYGALKMDSETMLKYLQNLMKLPNSIEKFIERINNPNSRESDILVNNLISLKELNKFLNENSSDGIQKLMQTISQSLKKGIEDNSQLREMLSALSLIQSKSEINLNTLKEFLLLYIPLNYPFFKDSQTLGEVEENYSQKIQNSSLSILFETINFSNILCTINELEGVIYVDIISPSNFDDEKFKLILERFSKQENFRISVKIEKKQSSKTTSNRNFKIISAGFIPQNVLILAHIVIKSVFEIDRLFQQKD